MDPALGERVQTLSKRFFASPEADKLAVEMVNSPHFRGYTRVGREITRERPDWREQLDTGLLTAVLQDTTSGLQVETDQGWIDAEPVAGTFVVNIGELLELATDGYLKATVHRVVSPGPGKDRISAAFFLGASFDAVVRPLTLPPALAADAHGPDRDPDNPLFYEVGMNTLKSRLRSHPDVAKRHYADPLQGSRDAG